MNISYSEYKQIAEVNMFPDNLLFTKEVFESLSNTQRYKLIDEVLRYIPVFDYTLITKTHKEIIKELNKKED